MLAMMKFLFKDSVREDWVEFVAQRIAEGRYDVTNGLLAPVGSGPIINEWNHSQICWGWSVSTPFVRLTNGENGNRSLLQVEVSRTFLSHLDEAKVRAYVRSRLPYW